MEQTTGSTKGMQQVEANLGQPLQMYLQDAYNDRRMSMAEIGVELGVDKATVSRWMKQLGVRGIRYVGYTGRKSA
jgi:DNA-binding MurR/RpiR family transcriptional regulator